MQPDEEDYRFFTTPGAEVQVRLASNERGDVSHSSRKLVTGGSPLDKINSSVNDLPTA
jgi:hypothetical protein